MASEDKDVKKETEVHPRDESTTEERGQTGSLRALFVLLAGAAIALGFFIYSGIRSRLEAASVLQRTTEEAAITDVVVVHPKRDPPTEVITLPGGTQPYINSLIYARTNGYLVNWFYDIGARVKKGDLLAVIDTPELDKQLLQSRADLETSKANLALAKITADRWLGLIKTHSVSQQSTDQHVQNLGAMEATVDSYAANVRRLEDLVGFEKVMLHLTESLLSVTRILAG